MKELSIEEKAKAYDEAIEKAKEMIKSMTNIGGVANVADIQYLFTELKESEDEKTKRLLHTIANKMSQHLRDIFTEEEFQCFDAWSNAWLEKQGEPTEINPNEFCLRLDRLLKQFESLSNEEFISTLSFYLNVFRNNGTYKETVHYELEEFAKIVRGNLGGISRAVQELFEAKYLQLTGNKMYGGYKD